MSRMFNIAAKDQDCKLKCHEFYFVQIIRKEKRTYSSSEQPLGVILVLKKSSTNDPDKLRGHRAKVKK